MPNYQRKEIVPGLFVLAAAAVFALYAFRVGRWEVLDILKGDRLLCRAVFGEVKSLVVGARVVVAGRRVGAVNHLAWIEQAYTQDDLDRLRRQPGTLSADVHAGDRRLAVEVDFELTDPSLRVDKDSAVVAIQQDGLLGQHYIDLYPGSWSAGHEPPTILAAGHAEPLRLRVREAGGLEALAGTVGDAVASIQTLVKLLHEQVFSTANRENLAGALAAIKGAAEELRQLLAADGELHGRALEPLQRLLDSAAATVTSMRDTTLPRADHLLDEANGSAQEFRAALAAVRKDLGAVFGQLQGTLLENRPELAESVQRLRSVLWQAEMALRKIRANPAVLLFGSAEQDLEAREFDESGARATGRARIFQQRDERAGGR